VLAGLTFPGCQAIGQGKATFSIRRLRAVGLGNSPRTSKPNEHGGSILVIRFKRRGYSARTIRRGDRLRFVGAADPDGSRSGCRWRASDIKTMTAGERVFRHMLPDGWTSAARPAAQVVRELSTRAAERALRQQRAANDAKKRPIRSAPREPTFVRFVFEMPTVSASP